MPLSLLSDARKEAEAYARSRPAVLAEEPTGFGENYAATIDAETEGRLSTSFEASRHDALDKYLQRYEEITGERLPNPELGDARGRAYRYQKMHERITQLRQQRPELADFPDFSDALIAEEYVKRYGPALAREQAVASRQTFGGAVGGVAGNIVGAMKDPINQLSMLFGAPIASGIGRTMLIEGLVSAASETAIQAGTFKTRAMVEPDRGLADVAAEVGLAAAGGALVGGSVKALGLLWGRVRGTRSWPRRIEDAGNVVEQDAWVQNTAPRQDSDTLAAHREALAKAAEDVAADRRVEIDPESFLKFNQRVGRVFDAENRQVAVGYEVVDVSDLVTSHDDGLRINPDFPADLQPRQRDRALSATQIESMAGNLEPERLGPSISAAEGAPIVGPDGVVESGNARVLAIRRAYLEDDVAALNYRAWLQSQGFDVDGVERPVLVARRTTPLQPEERVAFTTAANRATTLRLSPTEQAIADAKAISPETLDLLDGDNLTTGDNAAFVRGVLRKLPRAEHGNMLAREGVLSAEGVRRLEAALIARAFGRVDILDRVLEDADSNMRRIGRALIGTSPKWARLRDAVARGEVAPHMDATDALLDAVEVVMRARDEGVPVHIIADQMSLLGDDVTGMRRAFLSAMFKNGDYTNPVGQARLRATLDAYADEAMRVTGEPDLLGDTVTGERALGAVLERQGRQDIAADMFDALDDESIEAGLGTPETRDAVIRDVERLRAARLTGEEPGGELTVPIGDDVTMEMRSVEDMMAAVDDEIAAYDEIAACATGTAAE